MPRRNPERDDKIVKMFEEGNSVTQIGVALGLTRSTVAGVLLRADKFPSSSKHKSGTRYQKKGSDYWDTHLIEPWAVYHARKVKEREEARRAANRRA